MTRYPTLDVSFDPRPRVDPTPPRLDGLRALHFRSLVHPPLVSGKARLPHTGVWTTQGDARMRADSLLTLRRLAMQTIQLKLDQLTGSYCKSWNPTLMRFVEDELEHVYVPAPDYARFAAQAQRAQGEPTLRPAFIDEDRGWLLVDTDRFFVADQDTASPAAYEAIVAAVESPAFALRARELLRRQAGDDTATAMTSALRRLLHTLVRQTLGDASKDLPDRAYLMVLAAGWGSLARALFACSLVDLEAVCAVFADLTQVSKAT